MRFSELNIHTHLVEQDGRLQELTFHGSQCTKDCSGHRAGYKWSLDRGGVENPASPSQSFVNGANIGVRMLNQRPQGGGKVPGYASQTTNAVRKREQRAAARLAAQKPEVPPVPQTGPMPIAESSITWAQALAEFNQFFGSYEFIRQAESATQVQYIRLQSDDDDEQVYITALIERHGHNIRFMFGSITNGEMDEILDDYKGMVPLSPEGVNHVILTAEEAFGL
jgi:hypothetical protein